MANKRSLSMLIVSDKSEFTTAIQSLLEQKYSASFTVTTSQLQARNFAREEEYDVILVNCPLDGTLGDELAQNLVKLSYASVVLLSPTQITDRLKAKVEPDGVLVLEKPLKKEAFLEGIRLAVLVSQRTRFFYEENVRLKRKMAEMKKVDQAKGLLIEYLKLSEPQAHHYIEQQAMELRKTKGEVAQSIINTYQA